MKRHGNLWEKILAFENLVMAAHQAQKGKRFRENVLAFNYHLERHLFTLQTQLRTQTYQPGQYRTFRIYDPKPRLISAAPYRDRVVLNKLTQRLHSWEAHLKHGNTYQLRRDILALQNLV